MNREPHFTPYEVIRGHMLRLTEKENEVDIVAPQALKGVFQIIDERLSEMIAKEEKLRDKAAEGSTYLAASLSHERALTLRMVRNVIRKLNG